jgi:hypothetical protein
MRTKKVEPRWENFPKDPREVGYHQKERTESRSSRLKVPGGWLVRHIETAKQATGGIGGGVGIGIGVGMTFLPDPNHEWEFEVEEEFLYACAQRISTDPNEFKTWTSPTPHQRRAMETHGKSKNSYIVEISDETGMKPVMKWAGDIDRWERYYG